MVLLSTRVLPLLRLAIGLAIVGIVVLVLMLVQAIVLDDAGAPQSAAERATVAAQEAVRVNPDDAKARVRLAAAYLEQGSTSQAVEQAEIAVRLAPDEPTAYFVRGLAEERQGNLEAARADLQKASGLEGEFAAFYQEVYMALSRVEELDGDLDAALVAVEKALEFGPENATLLVRSGDILLLKEKWLEAAYDYSWALKYVPDYQEAIDGLEQVREADPDAHQEAVEKVESEAQGH